MSEPTAEPSVQTQDYLAEYDERRRIHVRNYALYMGSIFAALGAVFLIGLLAVADSYNSGQRAGALTRGFNDFMVRGQKPVLPPPTPAWYRPTQLGLGVVALALGAFVLVCKRVLPIPLLCPQCDVRLDEIGLFDGRCPKCQARLR